MLQMMYINTRFDIYVYILFNKNFLDITLK